MTKTWTPEQIIAEIVTAKNADTLAPACFSHCYGRAATAAAFRMAKARGLITVRYISCAGTPVYALTQAARALADCDRMAS